MNLRWIVLGKIHPLSYLLTSTLSYFHPLSYLLTSTLSYLTFQLHMTINESRPAKFLVFQLINRLIASEYMKMAKCSQSDITDKLIIENLKWVNKQEIWLVFPPWLCNWNVKFSSKIWHVQGELWHPWRKEQLLFCDFILKTTLYNFFHFKSQIREN